MPELLQYCKTQREALTHAPIVLSTGRICLTEREPRGNWFSFPDRGPAEFTHEEYEEQLAEYKRRSPSLLSAVVLMVT